MDALRVSGLLQAQEQAGHQGDPSSVKRPPPPMKHLCSHRTPSTWWVLRRCHTHTPQARTHEREATPREVSAARGSRHDQQKGSA